MTVVYDAYILRPPQSVAMTTCSLRCWLPALIFLALLVLFWLNFVFKPALFVDEVHSISSLSSREKFKEKFKTGTKPSVIVQPKKETLQLSTQYFAIKSDVGNSSCPQFGNRTLQDVLSPACGVPAWQRPSCEVPGRYSGVKDDYIELAKPDTVIFMGESHTGRLGNVLFTYASAWATARRYTELTGRPSCALYANSNLISLVRPGDLPIRHVRNTEISFRSKIVVPNSLYPVAPVDVQDIATRLRKSKYKPHYIILGGYLHSEVMFATHRDGVRKLFMPRVRKRDELLVKYPQLPNAICMHVRLGDKINAGDYTTMLGPYYKGALTALNATLPDPNSALAPPLFIAVERAAALQRFDFLRDLVPKYGATVFPGPPEDDMWALSLCGRGIIAASSSFSWWAAYLRANLSTPVVLPRSHYVPAEPSYPGWMFPAEAIVLEADGSIARPE